MVFRSATGNSRKRISDPSRLIYLFVKLDANKELIKLAGGKAILRTCAQASIPHIAAGVLFIRPTNTDGLPDWPTAQQNFHEQ